MKFLANLLGGGAGKLIDSVAGGVTKVKESFSTNKEADAKRLHEADITGMAYTSQVSRQYQAEFGHNRTWFDSLINGINRLQRPAFVGTFLYICIVLPILDPELATIVYSSLALVPEYLWYAFLTIMTFLFGGRPIEKIVNQKDAAKRRGEALMAIRELQKAREERINGERKEQEEYEEKTRKLPEESQGQNTKETIGTIPFIPFKAKKTTGPSGKTGRGKNKKRPGSAASENQAIKDLVGMIKAEK